MNHYTLAIESRALVSGRASGTALVLSERLSFWGGFDPRDGRIIDVHHPQFQQCVGASILCIPSSQGSAGTPGGIAESLRNGSGPLAFVLAEADVNIGVGVLVANKLYGWNIPVQQITADAMSTIRTGDKLVIDASGLLLTREGA